MHNRRRFLASTVTGLAMIALAGCGPIKEDKKQVGSNGFADLDQTDAVKHGPVASHIPSSPVLDAIRKRGRLNYSGTDTLPGFSLLSPITRKTVGFDRGIAELFAKYILGSASVALIKSGVDSREAALQNHTVDAGIGTYSITPERSRLVGFAGPYLTITSGVAVRTDDNFITKPSDLAGRKVAVQPGAAQENLLQEVPDAKPVLFEESTQCVTALQQGRVDAWTANTAILNGLVATDSRTLATDVRFGTTKFGIGLPKDDPVAVHFANEFINTIAEDGTWKMLWDSTGGKIDTHAKPKLPHSPSQGETNA
jgi:glutamate transport system substrate-binding protein